jgi:hypothetical protein
MLALWASAAASEEFAIRVAPPSEPGAIGRALAAAREHRRARPEDAVTLLLQSGTYRVTAPIVLGPGDSGVPGGPLTLRGAAGGGTVLSGAVPLGSTRAQPSWMRGAAPHAGAEDFSAAAETGHAFFAGDRRLVPTRMPTAGFDRRTLQSVGEAGDKVAIQFPPNEFERLAGQPNLWVSGYLAYDWLREVLPVTGFDPETKSLIVDRQRAFPPRPIGRIAVHNAALGPGVPGTIVLDRGPRGPSIRDGASGPDGEVIVSRGVLVLKDARWIRLANLAIERSFGPALAIDGSRDVSVEDCYVGQTIGVGLRIDGGEDVAVRRCVVADTTATGVTVSGGDRPSLTASRHRIEDSVISRFGQVRLAPGLSLSGVGATVSGCLIVHGPHWGIQVVGNDHSVAGNEFADLVRETDDAGVIYMGRDWTQRGNRFAFNFLHDFGPVDRADPASVFGIYLDDQFSGAEITGNVIVGGRYGVLVGGGRDNRVVGNLFVAPREAGIFMDDRGLAWQQAYGNPDSVLMKKLHAVDIQSAAWRARYPALAAFPDDRPGAPVGNAFEDNLAVDAPVAKAWRASTVPFLRETGSRTVSPAGLSDWSAMAIGAFAAQVRPGTPPAPLADRRSALAGLAYFDRAEIGGP